MALSARLNVILGQSRVTARSAWPSRNPTPRARSRKRRGQLGNSLSVNTKVKARNAKTKRRGKKRKALRSKRVRRRSMKGLPQKKSREWVKKLFGPAAA